MEKREHYRHIVQDILTTIAHIPYSDPEIVHEAVFDTVNDHQQPVSL